MKEYVLSVAGAVLLSAVAALVLPKGKIAGSIRFVLKLICLLALVSPFFTLFSETDPPELSSGDGYFAACASLAERSEEERDNLRQIVLFHGVFSFRCAVLFYGFIIR